MKDRVTRFIILILCFVPFVAFAQTETKVDLTNKKIETISQASLLNNRFRVDPSIKKITLMIHREENSAPVILVRPDGVKYYSWQNNPDLLWHNEQGIDIITVNNPMAGPWQAIGAIHPENKILLLSNVTMNVTKIPERLYQDEQIKLTAQVTENKKPLINKAFLERLKLTAVAYKQNEDASEAKHLFNTESESKSESIISLGVFFDNGEGLDEVAYDSTFTVQMNINLSPGMYRIRLESDNQIFWRTFEQTVFVFPSPLRVQAVKSNDPNASHQVRIHYDPETIVADSVLAHIELQRPNGQLLVKEGQVNSQKTTNELLLDFKDKPEIGQYRWSGWLYATALLDKRALVFQLPLQNFATNPLVAIAHEEKIKAIEQEQAAQELARLAQQKAEKVKKVIFWIIAINLGMIVIIGIGYLLWRREKLKNAGKLDIPPL